MYGAAGLIQSKSPSNLGLGAPAQPAVQPSPALGNGTSNYSRIGENPLVSGQGYNFGSIQPSAGARTMQPHEVIGAFRDAYVETPENRAARDKWQNEMEAWNVAGGEESGLPMPAVFRGNADLRYDDDVQRAIDGVTDRERWDSALSSSGGDPLKALSAYHAGAPTGAPGAAATPAPSGASAAPSASGAQAVSSGAAPRAPAAPRASDNLGLGAPSSSSGGMNPYLGAQANAIEQQANQNLMLNVMPQINSGAMMAGQYGSSRQGIAQGVASGIAAQGASNAIANLYGSAYQADQANQTQRYGIDVGANTSRYNTDTNAATSRYNTDASTALGYAGLANNRDIAGMNNATTMRGQDMNYGLGMAGLDNSYNIASMGNDTTRRGQDFNRDIAGMQNDTNRRGQDLTYDINRGNLNLGYLNSDRNYDLGLRGDQRANDQLDWNIDTGNYNRSVTNLGLGIGLINQGLDWQRQANNIGTTVQNAPINYWQQFLNGSTQAGGQGASSSQTLDGNPLLGFLGGANLFNQFLPRG